MKKDGSNTAVWSGSCIIWIPKNIQKYWMFAVFIFNTTVNQTNKQNMLIITYKVLLGTCIKSKKVAYILYVPNKIKSMLVKTVSPRLALCKNCLATCQSLFWHVQLVDLPHKCLRTRHKSLKSLINTNKCQSKLKR